MGRRRRRKPYRVGDEEDDGPATITPRAAAQGQQIARLEADPRIRSAALIASTFSLDPVAVLDEADELTRLVRIAAHNVAVREQEKAQQRH